MSISKFGTTNSSAPIKVIEIENKVSKSGDIMCAVLCPSTKNLDGVSVNVTSSNSYRRHLRR